MENTVVKDVILDKKIEGYSYKNENFLASGELTVTITLSEYRQLVKDCSTAQARIDEAEKDRYKRNSENDTLRKEIAELKAELYEMRKASEILYAADEESMEWKSE